MGVGRVSFSRKAIAKGVLKTTLPVLITRVLDLLCGVMSHVCVTEVPSIKAATLKTIKLYFPVVIVVATFDGLFKDNNSMCVSIVAVMSDIHRVIRAPVCTVGRKASPVLDCGCKTRHPGGIGGTVYMLAYVVLVCATVT